MALPAIENKEQTVQAMFTSIAPCYDLNNSLLSLGLHHGWKRAAVESLRPPDGGTVLDLCSGTGDLVLGLGRKYKALSAIASLDLNAAMLRLGREKIEKARVKPAVVFTVGNAETLPFPSSAFDGVTIAFGIRNVTERGNTLAEILRVLRPGGQFVCLEFSMPGNPLVRRIYDLYSSWWIPWIASRLSGDKTGTYQYLPDSIRAFPDPDTFKRLLLDAGFSNVSYRRLSLGIVTIHTAAKPVA